MHLTSSTVHPKAYISLEGEGVVPGGISWRISGAIHASVPPWRTEVTVISVTAARPKSAKQQRPSLVTRMFD
jgi:hypothetical protein